MEMPDATQEMSKLKKTFGVKFAPRWEEFRVANGCVIEMMRNELWVIDSFEIMMNIKNEFVSN